MSTRVPLTGEQYAVLCDPVLLSEKRRRPLMRAQRSLSKAGRDALQQVDAQVKAGGDQQEALAALELSDADMEALWVLNDTAAAVLIDEWSFEPDCPPSADDVASLPRPDYALLVKAAAPLAVALFADSDPTPDPKVGTAS
ncbi:MAG: hypothetical protein ACYDA6_00120 [Solirubrobacteraceae bacterium]